VRNYVVIESPAVSPGLIEFVNRSIEVSGRCIICDKTVLAFLFGVFDTHETKMRRLRLFARQHGWALASRSEYKAVFTSATRKDE